MKTENKMKTVTTVLDGMNNTIRHILKTNNPQLIENLHKQIYLNILVLANNYTGANFQVNPSETEKALLKSSTNFIVEMFPQINIHEIEQAFMLAASNKFPEINIQTYHGKFNNQILGNILNAYITKVRTKIIIENGKRLEIEMKEQQMKLNKKLNEKAIKDSIQKYTQIKDDFLKEGIMPEINQIPSYWGKLLTQKGIIKLSVEVRKEIMKNAKALATNQMREDVSNLELKAEERNHIKHIIKAVAEGTQNDDFDKKVIANYSKLIVIKSIIL